MRRRRSLPQEERYTVFRHDPGNPFSCFYCGEPASTLDHCPPITRTSDYEALGLEHEVYVKVSACEECNRLLADSLQVDILEREREAKARLEARYRSVLDGADWADWEVEDAELRGELRRRVRAHKNRRDWVLDRLDYSLGVNSYLHACEDWRSPWRLAEMGADTA